MLRPIRSLSVRKPALVTLTAALAATLGLGTVAAPQTHAGLLTDLLNPCGYTTPRSDTGVDVTAIKQLKASYFADIDAKDWSGLRELLAPDVIEDTSCSGGPVFYGRDPFIAFLQVTLGGATTHHQGYDPKIAITSPTTAKGLWTLEDVLVFGGTIGVHGYGHYNDHYAKVDGHWVVTYSKLTRTRLDLINADGSVIKADATVDEVVAALGTAVGG